MPMEPMLDSYNENSTLQATCQSVGNSMLADMAAAYGDTKAGKGLKFVRVAEYGCSGGRNSYLPMHAIISSLRGMYPAIHAECVLEDLPSNPWHKVMEEIPRLTSAFKGSVQVLCAGTSFYEQVCADESLDLAYSYVASHFLSRPSPLSSHVLMHESTNGERVLWQAQAARDWENFLLLRARELKPGGRMMISTMSRDSSGYSWERFSNVVWEKIQQVHSKGLLEKREVEALCIPACLRSEAEIMAPFGRGSTVGSLLDCDSLEFLRTEVPGERNLPVSVLAPILRRRTEAVWGGMFLTQLRRFDRTDSSAKDVMNTVWDLFEEAISKDTSLGWLDMRFFCLQATRKQPQGVISKARSQDGVQLLAEGLADRAD